MTQRLYFPLEQNFTCTSCGKCCNAHWRIGVTPEKKEVIESTQAFSALKKKGFQPLTVREGAFELNRDSSGQCYFHQNDLCAIHAEAGPDAKPAACKLYPFQLVASPDGHFVSLSFSCPAVVAGVGGDSSEHRNELEQTIASAPHFFPPQQPASADITISEGFQIPWTSYLIWETDLIDSLRHAQTPVEALFDGVSRLTEAVILNQEPVFRQTHTSLSSLLKKNLMELAPFFTVITLSNIEEYSDLGRRKELVAQLTAGSTFHSRLLNTRTPKFRPHRPFDLLTTSIIQRFVTAQIWGKRLITGPTFLSRLLFLAISLEVFRFYLETYKLMTDEKHYSQSGVEWCFDFMENELLHHHDILFPAFLEWERDLLEFGRHFHNQE